MLENLGAEHRVVGGSPGRAGRVPGRCGRRRAPPDAPNAPSRCSRSAGDRTARGTGCLRRRRRSGGCRAGARPLLAGRTAAAARARAQSGGEVEQALRDLRRWRVRSRNQSTWVTASSPELSGERGVGQRAQRRQRRAACGPQSQARRPSGRRVSTACTSGASACGPCGLKEAEQIGRTGTARARGGPGSGSSSAASRRPSRPPARTTRVTSSTELNTLGQPGEQLRILDQPRRRRSAPRTCGCRRAGRGSALVLQPRRAPGLSAMPSTTAPGEQAPLVWPGTCANAWRSAGCELHRPHRYQDTPRGRGRRAQPAPQRVGVVRARRAARGPCVRTRSAQRAAPGGRAGVRVNRARELGEGAGSRRCSRLRLPSVARRTRAHRAASAARGRARRRAPARPGACSAVRGGWDRSR